MLLWKEAKPLLIEEEKSFATLQQFCYLSNSLRSSSLPTYSSRCLLAKSKTCTIEGASLKEREIYWKFFFLEWLREYFQWFTESNRRKLCGLNQHKLPHYSGTSIYKAPRDCCGNLFVAATSCTDPLQQQISFCKLDNLYGNLSRWAQNFVTTTSCTKSNQFEVRWFVEVTRFSSTHKAICCCKLSALWYVVVSCPLVCSDL